MNPTAEQLKDPKWWDANAPTQATHISSHGDFFWNDGHNIELYSNKNGWVEFDIDSTEGMIPRPTHSVDAAEKVKHSKYHHEIATGVWVDVYDVIKAWGVTNPAQQHLIKKALQAGDRGHKDYAEDMDDIIASAKRAKELDAPTR